MLTVLKSMQNSTEVNLKKKKKTEKCTENSNASHCSLQLKLTL